MFTGYPSRTTQNKRKQPQTQGSSCHISRLLAAAVINKGFRELLLSDPARALAQGYYGEKFPLDYEQKALILSIRAESLKDFALQLTSTLEVGTARYTSEWIPVNQSAFALDAK